MSDDFADFYAAAFSKVQRAALAFCGRDDVAHEATQEAFARAFARWRRIRRAESREAWVTTTALNLTKRHFSDRARATNTTQPQAITATTGERLDVLAALRLLPERQRQAIVLHYIVDLSVHSVAEAMGLSDGAVKAHLHKGRAALRSPLEAIND